MAERLGHYEIFDVFLSSDSGRIWYARDTGLDREVLLEEPTPAGDGPEARDSAWRALQDRARAQARAAESNPYIRRIHAVEELDGRRVIAAELVEGKTLAQRLAEGPMDATEARSVAVQLLNALAAAHRQGVVHGHLRPSCVLLAPTGVKLDEFGGPRVGASSGGFPAGGAGAAADGGAAGEGGTAEQDWYRSPESLRGQPTGPGADLFAAGLLIWQMATGKHPFSSAQATDHMSLAYRLAHEPLPPPEGADAQWLGPILAKATAKEPAERFADADEFARALATRGQATAATVVEPAPAADDAPSPQAPAAEAVEAAPATEAVATAGRGGSRTKAIVIGALVVLLAVGGAAAAGALVSAFTGRASKSAREQAGTQAQTQAPVTAVSDGGTAVQSAKPKPKPYKPGTWIWNDLDEAKAAARAQSKPILADFWASWCPWCIKMDKTYRNSSVLGVLKRDFVLLKFDTDKMPKISSRYGVNGYPTAIVLSASGRELVRVVGYKDVGETLTFLAAAKSRAR